MKRWRALVVGLLLSSSIVAGILLLGGSPAADTSVLSPGARGWLAARRYLEARGCEVTLLDETLDSFLGRDALVLGLPWQRMGFDEDFGLDRHLGRGTTILLAYGGNPFDPFEEHAFQALGLSWDEPRRPPLNPWRWWSFAREEWTLLPDPSLGPNIRAAHVGAPRRVPRAPEGARVLFRREGAKPAVFLYPRSKGRVVVFPSDLLANARISTPGNADALEALLSLVGNRWTFDEFHHGLSASLKPIQRDAQRILVFFLAQIVFVYLLALLAVARRFGPPWIEPSTRTGSTGSFLLGLGALHQRLGHHEDAGRLLLTRSRELDPRIGPLQTLEFPPDGFLALARKVGRAQSRKAKRP